MKKNILLFSLLFVLFASCRTYYVVDNTKSSFNKIDKKLDGKDELGIDKLIEPYKKTLSNKMGEVLGYSEGLSKNQPESTLGNWMTDAMLSGAEKMSNGKVDFAIQNYGGIRLKELPRGAITLGKIFELMPFNNYLVILETDGATTQKLFDRMADYGGWPISKSVHYAIEKGKAKDITINGQKFDVNKTYVIALPDYVANGGDKCSFLKDTKRLDIEPVLIRDILAANVRELNKNGKHISSNIEGRVVK